ncbi:MAG: hypothetical protein K6T83_23410 [Alicyclobacillus sp.]|nr:hypothetical protein [Alicyclobacillus sp.]
MNLINGVLAGVAGAAVLAAGFFAYVDNQKVSAASPEKASSAKSTDVLHNAMDKHQQAMVNEIVKEAGKKKAIQLHTMLQRDAAIIDSMLYHYGPAHTEVGLKNDVKIIRPPGGKQLQEDYKSFERMFTKPIPEWIGNHYPIPRILRVHQLANQNSILDSNDSPLAGATTTFNQSLAIIDSAYQSALVMAGVSPLPNTLKSDGRGWENINLNPSWPKDGNFGPSTKSASMNAMLIPDVLRQFDQLWFGGHNPYVPAGK